MRDDGRDDSEQQADGLILEGEPPGWGRPSWLGLVIAVVISLAAGAALGYGVHGPAVPHTQCPEPVTSDEPVAGSNGVCGEPL